MMCNPYENAALTSACGGSMHPGGLRLTSRAARIAGLSPGMKVLDIGCGEGVTLQYLKEKHGVRPHGIDVSAELIAKARERCPGADFTAAGAIPLPYDDAGFGAVISECTFSVIGDYPGLLGESFRVLKSGGRLIVSDIWSKDGLLEIREIFKNAGFRVVFFEEHLPALVTYALSLRQAGIDPRALCGDVQDRTYYLIICEKPDTFS